MAPKSVQRNAGLNFFSKRREEKLAAQAETTAAAQRTAEVERAAAIADAQATQATLETPVESLQEAMVGVQGDPTGAETYVGDSIENISRAELSPITEVEATQTMEDIADVPMRQYQQQGIFPGSEDIESLATPEEKQALAEGTILGEASKARGVLSDKPTSDAFTKAVDDYIAAEVGSDDGFTTFRNLIDRGRNAFRTDAGGFNIFGTDIDVSNISDSELSTDPQGVIYRNSDTIMSALKGNRKLNLLEDPTDSTSQIRKEAGAAAMMAVLLEVSNKLQLVNSESDKESDNKQYSNALDRIVLGSSVGRTFERLLYPTEMENPQDLFKGETEKYGYQYRLEPDESSLLGQALLQGLVDMKGNDLIESKTVIGSDGKPKVTFVTTREGDAKLSAMRRGIRQQLGMSALKERPVSTVQTDQGRSRGEGAYTQKEVTQGPLKNKKTKTINDGISALASVSHTVAPHAATLFAGVLTAGKKYSEGIFADVTKQGSTYFENKRAELLADYLAKAKTMGLTPGDIGSYRKPNGAIVPYGQGLPGMGQLSEAERQIKGFEQAAFMEAKRIQRNHLDERSETLLDGFNRVNTSFYYGYTVINNSSRMMISNDELNYQSNKLARFLVSGTLPSLFSKNKDGGAAALNSAIKKLKNNERKSPGDKGYQRLTTEEGFFRVIARSVVVGADKLSPAEQVQALQEDLITGTTGVNGGPPKRYLKFGTELLAYTKANEDYHNQVAAAINNQQPPPEAPELLITQELNDFLASHNRNDTFYFALDALHELARYGRTPNGERFGTRVKAEIDGNSNGAVIQAYQMGVENILRRGGVLYAKIGDTLQKIMPDQSLANLSREEAENLELDIREDVFNIMASQESVQKDLNWGAAFNAIGNDSTLVKKLMKIPIMTSIYGKDPRFHSDTAKKFFTDNPKIFSAMLAKGDLDSDQIIKQLTKFLEQGLELGLGGALEHAKIAKRNGRAHVFGNEIFVMEGYNGWQIQAGGYEYVEKAPAPRMARGKGNTSEVRFGPGADRNVAYITVTEPRASATVMNTPKYVGEGNYSKGEIGGKLMNQAAVNSTQNIDATVAQLTVASVVNRRPNGLVMQVYDAFIGDSTTFADLENTANTIFDKVNQEYNMLEEELKAFDQMVARVKNKIKAKRKTGDTFDIGTEGEYKGMGDFLNVDSEGKRRWATIIGKDMVTAESTEKKQAIRLASQLVETIASQLPPSVMLGDKSVKVSADIFEYAFESAIDILKIRRDLVNLIAKTNKERKRLNAEPRKRGQYS